MLEIVDAKLVDAKVAKLAFQAKCGFAFFVHISLILTVTINFFHIIYLVVMHR